MTVEAFFQPGKGEGEGYDDEISGAIFDNVVTAAAEAGAHCVVVGTGCSEDDDDAIGKLER